MSKKPIYIDMDNVLIAPIVDPIKDEPVDLLVRPGVKGFLESLSAYGDLKLLSAASFSWVKIGLRAIGPVVRIFKDVFSGEDLFPIAQQIDVVDKAQGLTPEDRQELYQSIEPILPPGVMFDDFPVGSGMYRLKGIAIGIMFLNPNLWIQVESFSPTEPDRDGLAKAYEEFQKRNNAWRGRPAMGSMKKAGDRLVLARSAR